VIVSKPLNFSGKRKGGRPNWLVFGIHCTDTSQLLSNKRDIMLTANRQFDWMTLSIRWRTI